MDKVAEILATIPYERNDSKLRVIRDELKSGELSFDDIKNYNANDNPTTLYFCPTCDNISELKRPNSYHGSHIVCYECECFF